GGGLHLLGRTLPDPLGVAVAPDALVEDALVTGVDRVVTDGLTVEVVGDRPAAEAVFGEDFLALLDVAGVLDGLLHVEVVARAGDLEAVVPPLTGEPAHLGEGEVCPLPGEQGDRAGLLRLGPSG